MIVVLAEGAKVPSTGTVCVLHLGVDGGGAAFPLLCRGEAPSGPGRIGLAMETDGPERAARLVDAYLHARGARLSTLP